VGGIYRESVGALNAGLYVLACIGIRTLIEGITSERDAPAKNLFAKIEHLATSGVVTRESADVLHKLRKLENQTVQEEAQPLLDKLKLAMHDRGHSHFSLC